MNDIFNEIKAERKRQDREWGGKKHDNKHNIRDWASFMISYLAGAVNKEASWGDNLKIARTAFIKVSALCVAAIEFIDRKTKKKYPCEHNGEIKNGICLECGADI